MTLPPRWLRKEEAGIRKFLKAPRTSFPCSPALDPWMTLDDKPPRLLPEAPSLACPGDHSRSSSLFPLSSLFSPLSKLTDTNPVGPLSATLPSLTSTSCFCFLPSKASKELWIQGLPFALTSGLCSPLPPRLHTVWSCFLSSSYLYLWTTPILYGHPNETCTAPASTPDFLDLVLLFPVALVTFINISVIIVVLCLSHPTRLQAPWGKVLSVFHCSTPSTNYLAHRRCSIKLCRINEWITFSVTVQKYLSKGWSLPGLESGTPLGAINCSYR